MFLSGCMTVDDAKTPQQKNLVPSAFETISSPVDDFISDSETDEFSDDEIDTEQAIGKKFHTPISISANEGMKLREVLTKMAEIAGIDIFIVQNVEGNLSFSAKNRPFINILKDICESAGLKYTIDGDSVKIEIDTPMLKVYNVQFLNIQRDTQSAVTVSTDIFMNQSLDKNVQNASNLTNNGSNSIISGITKNDFWLELESSLKTIIGEGNGAYLSTHKQGGLITVYTTQSKHNEIQKYLRLLKDTTESQVLIEAKILEVNLKDEYKSGINWNILGSRGIKLEKKFDNKELLSFGIDKSGLGIIAGLIERFGAVKTLSSPRITVLNNQPAIFKVAKNEVIYTTDIQRQYATVANNSNTDFVSTKIHTIPIGLILTVLPSIDKKSNTVLLNLRPTISKIASHKKVPILYSPSGTVATGQNQFTENEIPVVDVRELDSVLKLNSGQIVVMGGLMQETSNNNRNGLPGFKEADFLLGGNEKSTDVTELVIFLKATILRKKAKAHHPADKKIYDTFANDPRPLKFRK